MSLPVTIRPAAPEDAEALLSIYAPYVKHTAITFEYEVPSVEEFRKRIAHTLQHYPYLVAERGINSSAPGIKDEAELQCMYRNRRLRLRRTAPRPGCLCLVCGNFHLCKRIRKEIRNRQGALRFSGKSACRPEYDQSECLHRQSCSG